MRRISGLLLGVAASELIWACSSSPGTLPPDHEPPRVISRTPSPGTTVFDLRSAIEVEFSEPIDARTMDSVQLLGPQGAFAVEAVPSADRRRYTIRPLRPLAVAGTDALALEVLLRDAVRDDAGNALAVPADPWRFSAPAFMPVGNLGAPSAVPGGLAWSGPNLWLASIDREGAPTVARVRRFDGHVWTVLPEMGIDANSAELEIALALGASGEPIVAFTEANELYVRRWNGQAWEAFGGVGGPISGLFAYRPAIAVQSSGRPVVAWVENGLAYASRWSGTAFVPVGGAGVPTSGLADGTEPVSLALDGDTVLLAWVESDPATGSSHVRVHSSLGGTSPWAPIGGPISVNAGVNTSAPSLALDGTTPVVAFFEREACATCKRLVQVMRYRNAWEQVGGGERNRQGAQFASNPKIAVAGPDEYVVAWQESPSHNKVHLDQWDGTQWTALEASGLSAGGSASQLVLVLDAAGVPAVAWWEVGAPYLMYVSRYNR